MSSGITLDPPKLLMSAGLNDSLKSRRTAYQMKPTTARNPRVRVVMAEYIQNYHNLKWSRF